MSAVTRAAVEGVLRQYTDPYLNQDPVSAGCVRAIDIQGGQVAVQLQLGYAAGLFKNGWAQVLQTAIEMGWERELARAIDHLLSSRAPFGTCLACCGLGQ